jgi:hypothetical protein
MQLWKNLGYLHIVAHLTTSNDVEAGMSFCCDIFASGEDDLTQPRRIR